MVLLQVPVWPTHDSAHVKVKKLIFKSKILMFFGKIYINCNDFQSFLTIVRYSVFFLFDEAPFWESIKTLKKLIWNWKCSWRNIFTLLTNWLYHFRVFHFHSKAITIYIICQACIDFFHVTVYLKYRRSIFEKLSKITKNRRYFSVSN